MKYLLKWFPVGIICGIPLIVIGLVEKKITHSQRYKLCEERLIDKEDVKP